MTLRARYQLSLGALALDLDLQLPARGITALFGPSGSGKTSFLRCLAGLEPTARGTFMLGERCLQDSAAGVCVPAHARRIGMVFQDARLFAHLTVRGNLEFGWHRTPAAARRLTFEQVLAWLDLAPLLERAVDTLSGGERQRVAIGRALLMSPDLLLLDEPLSALDQARKQEILPYLQQLRDVLDIPIIYITHAIDEVVRLADHLVLIERGRCVAAGPLTDILSSLQLPPSFVDESSVVLPARVEQIASDGLAHLATPCGSVWLPAHALRVGDSTRVRIHSRDVSIALQPPQASSILNVLEAEIRAFAPTANGQVLVACRAGAAQVVARVTARSFAALGLAEGLRVWLQVKSVSLS